jgi:glycosyltransferase involved in cell wall biosynthesis
MRILVLTSMFPPHHYGGYELLCEDVVTRWRASGHDVNVLTTTMRVPGVDGPADDRAVHRDLDFYYRDSLVVRPGFIERLRIERQNQRSLAAALADVRPDVVSVWHMGAMSMGLLTTLARRSVPMVFVIGDLWPLYGPETDAWMRPFVRRPVAGRWAERITGLPATLGEVSARAAWTFASEWLRDVTQARSLFKPEVSAVVPHGIDLDVFRPAATSHEWHWRLAYMGRLDERKGVHFAVKALAHLPRGASLAICGRGDPTYVDTLRSLARELGVQDRVLFGEARRNELSGRYADADVVLFPPTWEEPFGLVPLEAMACGTPLVATATGGSAEFLVDEANALIVPRADERAIAEAVLRLERNEALRSRLVSGGLATAELFGVDRFAAALEEWHRSAIDRFRGGTPPTSPTARDELQRRGITDQKRGSQR